MVSGNILEGVWVMVFERISDLGYLMGSGRNFTGCLKGRGIIFAGV